MLDTLLSHSHQIALVCVFAAYFISAVTDFLFRKISFVIFAAYFAVAVDLFVNLSLLEILIRLVVAAVFFVALYIMAKTGASGGGDAIYIPILALIFPMPLPLLVILLGCALTAIYAVIRNAVKKGAAAARGYPLIPGMACALVIVYGTLMLRSITL